MTLRQKIAKGTYSAADVSFGFDAGWEARDPEVRALTEALRDARRFVDDAVQREEMGPQMRDHMLALLGKIDAVLPVRVEGEATDG